MEKLCATDSVPALQMATETGVVELNELQLALVGGGIGDVVGH
jgi:hypothetical protein